MSFHRWVSTDAPEHDSCLVCGGMWEWQPTSPNGAVGYHTAMNGDIATPCSGDTAQCHHFPGECPNIGVPGIVASCTLDVSPPCNCLFCDS